LNIPSRRWVAPGSEGSARGRPWDGLDVTDVAIELKAGLVIALVAKRLQSGASAQTPFLSGFVVSGPQTIRHGKGGEARGGAQTGLKRPRPSLG
jgi:hypothetical protein